MNKEEYVKQVMHELHIGRTMKKRIKADLEQRIDDAMDRDPYLDLVKEMGTPLEFATEFVENLEDPNELALLVRKYKPYEYKTKTTLFGLPLIHIHVGGGYGTTIAKGIVAIGDVAIGVVTVGGVSVGVVSIGGVAIGLAALGGVALGGIVAGGVAIGLLAFGGVSLGILKTFGILSLL